MEIVWIVFLTLGAIGWAWALWDMAHGKSVRESFGFKPKEK